MELYYYYILWDLVDDKPMSSLSWKRSPAPGYRKVLGVLSEDNIFTFTHDGQDYQLDFNAHPYPAR